MSSGLYSPTSVLIFILLCWMGLFSLEPQAIMRNTGLDGFEWMVTFSWMNNPFACSDCSNRAKTSAGYSTANVPSFVRSRSIEEARSFGLRWSAWIAMCFASSEAARWFVKKGGLEQMKSNFSFELNVKTFASMACRRALNGPLLKFSEATFATSGWISSAFTEQTGLTCAIMEANRPQPVPISKHLPRAFREDQAPKRQASVLIFNPGLPWCKENCLNSKVDLLSAIICRIFAPVLGFPLQDFGRIMITF